MTGGPNKEIYTQEGFVAAVCESSDSASIVSSKYCGHSFWIEAATTVAEQGIQDLLIRMLGTWQNSAYLLYICTPKDKICAVAKTLLEESQAAN